MVETCVSAISANTGGLPDLDQLVCEAESAGPALSWVAPLIESAKCNWRGNFAGPKLLTPWCEDEAVAVWLAEPDAAKHEQFRLHIVEALNQSAPWVLPLIEAAKAVVFAAPGLLFFTVPDSRNGLYQQAYDIKPLMLATLCNPLPPGPGESVH